MRIIIGAIIGTLFVGTDMIAGSITFDPQRGIVEVPVTLNGRVKGTFGIDTGADHLYVDCEFAERNRLQRGASPPQRAVVGVDGTSEASVISLRSLRVADESVHNLRAVVIDMDRMLGGEEVAHPDGLIGLDVLRRFYITIDFPRREFTLQTNRPNFLDTEGHEEIPFERQRHLITVDVVLNEGHVVPMFLDYCASYTSISQSLAERLGLDASQPHHRIETIRIGQRTFTEDVAVTVTDFSRFRTAVVDSEFEGILGASFLYSHKITIDYKRGRVFVHE